MEQSYRCMQMLALRATIVWAQLVFITRACACDIVPLLIVYGATFEMFAIVLAARRAGNAQGYAYDEDQQERPYISEFHG